MRCLNLLMEGNTSNMNVCGLEMLKLALYPMGVIIGAVTGASLQTNSMQYFTTTPGHIEDLAKGAAESSNDIRNYPAP